MLRTINASNHKEADGELCAINMNFTRMLALGAQNRIHTTDVCYMLHFASFKGFWREHAYMCILK